MTEHGSPEVEQTPWYTGLLVTAFATALTAVAVFAFGSALARIHPLLAVTINLVAVGGAAPTVWRWRSLPVVRWVIFGVTIGVVFGWVGLLADSL